MYCNNKGLACDQGKLIVEKSLLNALAAKDNLVRQDIINTYL